MASYKSEYMKERRRIQSWLRRAAGRGFETQYKLPAIPKRITEASIRRLAKITPEYLYKKSVWVSPETGEIFEGQQAKKEQRVYVRKPQKQKPQKQQTIELPKITDVVLRNVEQQIASWQAKEYWTSGLKNAKESEKNKAQRILQGAIDKLGREQVARNLQENAFEVNQLIDEILWGSGKVEGNFKDSRTQVNEDLVRFRNICYDQETMTQQEAIELSDAMEYNEIY